MPRKTTLFGTKQSFTLTLPMDPCDYKTWTSFADHPIFSDRKRQIAQWSSDPSGYCDRDSYSTFLVDWYVHRDPQLPTEEQARYASRDIRILAQACAAIEDEFGSTAHELFILDDMTTFVRLVSPQFDIEIYPDNLSDEGHILGLFVDQPNTTESEHHLARVGDVVPTLLSVLRSSSAK